jgi:hypothetical protein
MGKEWRRREKKEGLKVNYRFELLAAVMVPTGDHEPFLVAIQWTDSQAAAFASCNK